MLSFREDKTEIDNDDERVETGGWIINNLGVEGPSTYDVHTEGWGQAQVDTCGTGVSSMSPCGRPHRKLEPTDIILSSSHAKKLAFSWTKISYSDGIKSGNFSSI